MVALVLSLGVTSAFADTYSITIDNAVVGETYTVYKIFDVTYGGTAQNVGELPDAPAADNRSGHTAYTYTIDSTTSEWWSVIVGDDATADSDGVYTANGLVFTPTLPAGTYVVTEGTGFNAATFAALLNTNKTGKTPAATPVEAEAEEITINVNTAGAGYYFVDTSLGSLCSLDTTEPSATIREKNSKTTTDKTVKEDSTGEYGDKNDADVGDTVEFKTTVVIRAHQSNVILHDIMQTDKLAFNSNSVTVSSNVPEGKATILTGANIPDTNEYKDENGTKDTFAVKFDNAWTEGLSSDVTVTVTYTAVITKDAIVGLQENRGCDQGNDNRTSVTYGDSQRTSWDWTRTYTWELDVFKYTGDITNPTKLAGAEFEFARVTVVPGEGGNPDTESLETLSFVLTSAGDGTNPAVYKYGIDGTKTTKLVTPASGKIQIIGLDADTYKLTETKAPNGFNALMAPIDVVINSNTDGDPAPAEGALPQVATVSITQDGDATEQINVLNQSGSQLPSTGGIGTTIFYAVGGILVLAAIVLLITKKRMSD